MADGSHPPAVREVIIEADKAGEVHLKGIPTCRSGQLQATDTAAAMKACKKALIGTGHATAQLAFAEQRPINVNSKILVFSGGERGGKAKMFIHAYFSNPISGAIVTTVTIKKHHHGASAPWRSPRSRRSPAAADRSPNSIGNHAQGSRQEPDQRDLQGREAEDPRPRQVQDGTKAQTEIIRACTPKK